MYTRLALKSETCLPLCIPSAGSQAYATVSNHVRGLKLSCLADRLHLLYNFSELLFFVSAFIFLTNWLLTNSLLVSFSIRKLFLTLSKLLGGTSPADQWEFPVPFSFSRPHVPTGLSISAHSIPTLLQHPLPTTSCHQSGIPLQPHFTPTFPTTSCRWCGHKPGNRIPILSPAVTARPSVKRYISFS